VLSHCAQTEFAFVLRNRVLTHGYPVILRRPGEAVQEPSVAGCGVGHVDQKSLDNSANNWRVAFFTFGEGLQNNHHALPGAYRHGMRWWEPDLSGWVLAVLAKAGIVWDLKMPNRRTINSRLRRNRTSSTVSLQNKQTGMVNNV
jgi:hypothetical protein